MFWPDLRALTLDWGNEVLLLSRVRENSSGRGDNILAVGAGSNGRGRLITWAWRDHGRGLLCLRGLIP